MYIILHRIIDKKKDLTHMFIIPESHKQVSRKDAQDLKNNFKKRLKYINMNL